MNRLDIAARYLIAQGVMGLVWWALLLADTSVRGWFVPDATAWPAARSLVFADLVMFCGGSIAAGVLALRRHRWARPAGWIALGSTAYATLVAVGWLLAPVDHWLGLAAMAPTLAMTGLAVAVVAKEPRT